MCSRSTPLGPRFKPKKVIVHKLVEGDLRKLRQIPDSRVDSIAHLILTRCPGIYGGAYYITGGNRGHNGYRLPSAIDRRRSLTRLEAGDLQLQLDELVSA
jgi:hypothetical protein